MRGTEENKADGRYIFETIKGKILRKSFALIFTRKNENLIA